MGAGAPPEAEPSSPCHLVRLDAGRLPGGLVLRTTDLQADYERLVAAGVDFEGTPTDQPWGTETALHDPDGNGIVLQQARTDRTGSNKDDTTIWKAVSARVP